MESIIWDGISIGRNFIARAAIETNWREGGLKICMLDVSVVIDESSLSKLVGRLAMKMNRHA